MPHGPFGKNDRVQVVLAGDAQEAAWAQLRGEPAKIESVRILCHIPGGMIEKLSHEERLEMVAVANVQMAQAAWVADLDRAVGEAFVQFLRNRLNEKALKALAGKGP